MGLRNYLTPEEKQELQKQLKFHEHPDIRERILILLLGTSKNTDFSGSGNVISRVLAF